MSGITVLKLGGNALSETEKVVNFLHRFSDQKLVVVHGGGPQISAMLQKLGTQAKFQNGLRVTDRETLDAVRMVLAGDVNKKLVSSLRQNGFQAVGLCGVDGGTLLASPLNNGELGYVGQTPNVNPQLLQTLLQGGFLPVLAPLSAGSEGPDLNVNADTTAAAVAAALKADHLIFMTDVCGVLDGNGDLLPELDQQSVHQLHREGVVSTGMLPKLEAALYASGAGVAKVEIRGAQTGPGTLLKVA